MLRRHEEAREALAEYAASGGSDPYADDLRCRAGDPTADPDREAPVLVTSNVTAPRRLHTPAPGRRVAGPQRTVSLMGVVGTDGAVSCVKVLKAPEVPPWAIREAIETFRSWRFEPARLEDRPVPIYLHLTISF